VNDNATIHSGTRVKLKHVDESALPADFLTRLREMAHHDERFEAVYLCAVETDDRGEQLCLVIAVRSGLLGKPDDRFLEVVEELRLILPPGLGFNIYRFGASPVLARYCVESLEPIHLRSAAWLEKERKRLVKS
jgi:hypothetical protein